jgi:hypothetical protein
MSLSYPPREIHLRLQISQLSTHSPHIRRKRMIDRLSQSLTPLCKQPDCAVRDPVCRFEEDVVSVEETPVLLAEDI